jgi:hypothetical protein
MDDANPYVPPPDSHIADGQEPSRKCTRVAVAMFVTIVLLCATWHLIQGGIQLLSPSSPKPIYPENPLFPDDLTELRLATSQHDLREGRSAVVFGIVLALCGALTWRCRRKLVPTPAGLDGEGTNVEKWFRRYSLNGLAAACLCVIGSPDVNGLTRIWYVRTAQISEFFILVAFGACVLALAIGRDARIRIVDGLVPYSLAVLGALLACGISVRIFLDFVYRLLWRFGAMG